MGRQYGWKGLTVDEVAAEAVGELHGVLDWQLLHGSDLWMLVESEEAGQVMRHIAFAKITPASGGAWCFKGICDYEGLNARGCPREFLERCTEPMNDHARNWREAELAAA